MQDATSVSSPTTGMGKRVVLITVMGIAALAQLILLVPFTVASGLVAPLWAIVLFYGIWVVGAIAYVYFARRRPALTLMVPVVNGGLLYLGVTIGEMLLGWTA